MKTNQFRVVMLVVLILIISLGRANAQLITVSGKVIDAGTKAPIVACSVQIVGTMEGTLTDKNGDYSIQVTMGSTLSFSHVGYIIKKVKVTSPKLYVSLEMQKIGFNECVVVSENSSRAMPNTFMIRGVGATTYGSATNIPNDNREEYRSIQENGFKSIGQSPLSTFSIDVDAASYSNMRRFINEGKMPPVDAVRVEEMINYFTYNYPQPTGDDPVKISIEVGDCPWKIKNRLVRIGVKAKEIPTENLPASNLVFLIDVSGSMWGAHRLDLVKSSLKLLVNNLREKDKVAIVVYAGSADVKLEATSGNDKQKIKDVIGNLIASGSTAGGEGIQLAYKIARQNFVKGGNNRIILCTDGDFNVGISSETELERLIEKERKSGVYLTVLGYGMGNYKDNKMQSLAEKGNGNHAYIDNLQEANRVLVNEFGATLHTVAKDVKIQVEFNPSQAQAYRLVGYESRLLKDEDFNNDTKDAGEMGAGHTVTVLYEVIPVGMENDYVGKIDDLKYQKIRAEALKPTGSDELLAVKLRYKAPDKDVSKKQEVALVDNMKNDVSSDFKFASAVAMFGQLLRESDFKGDGSYDKVIELAKQGLNDDEKGYRREFVRLAEAAKGVSVNN